MKTGVSISANTRHKSVTTATYFEQAVAVRIFDYEADLHSTFSESLAKIDPGSLVETSGTCVFWSRVHPSTDANEPRDLWGYDTSQSTFIADPRRC